MVNTSSLPRVADVSFDLDSQTGIMQVLASLRTSDLSAAEKNELRDLVFLYSNGGKEPTVRRALEQKIALHKLVPPPPKVIAQPLPPPPTIGKYRAAPTFSVPVAPPVVSPSPESTFTTNPVWTRHESAPVVAETPEPAPVAPVTPLPELELIPEPVPVQVPIQAASVPVSAPEPAPAATSLPVGDNDAYLMRIREIKALVNEQVGNPVNLVDINNEVGREYMAALLDAMKKINSGTSAGSAMKRLEAAFAAVDETLKTRAGGGVAVVAPLPEPVSIPTPPVFEPVATEVNEQVQLATPENTTPLGYPNTTPVATTPPSMSDVPTSMHAAPPPPPPPVFEPSLVTVSVPDTPPPPPVYKPQAPVIPVVPLGEPAPMTPKQPESAAYFTSLAEYNSKPSPVAEPVRPIALKETVTAGDPLFTPQVDDGLQQLLVEWPIFKKSGIFGTGPKGREHPLFIKVAPLQIPLLLAGRFEGATQEIKQSITDYMNGWRYEQGIIYQQNETFEHYLRRVIHHILDLQHGK